MVVLTFHNRFVTVRLQFVYLALYHGWAWLVSLCYVMLRYIMLHCAMLCYVTVIRYIYKSFVNFKDFNGACCKIIISEHCNILFIFRLLSVEKESLESR